jgi:hypothetical protein
MFLKMAMGSIVTNPRSSPGLRQLQAMHLIIPYAAFADVPSDALHSLALPHLRQILGQMACTHRDEEARDVQPSPCMPHERVQARALGWLGDAPAPWAAWAHPSNPAPQAWITPCHWQIGMDQVVMLDPAYLQLSDEESQQLLQAMQPFLQEDGLDVRWHSPLMWHATGPVFAGMQAVSLDRVSGANVKPWITDGHLPPSLRRLQSEMQMLLYNHPVNDARLAQGRLTVNSFWVHGAGALPAHHEALPASEVQVIDSLRAPALQGDVQAWLAAWQQVDAEHLAPLSQHSGLRLTLCSETSAHTYQRTERSWLQRLGAAFHKTDTGRALQALIPT